MPAACASCRLNRACNEIDGLLRGLAQAVKQEGMIPPRTGGVIGLARQEAQLALQTISEIRRGPHPVTADPVLDRCHDELVKLLAISNHRVSATEVPMLAWYADEAAWASWQVSWAVYGRFP